MKRKLMAMLLTFAIFAGVVGGGAIACGLPCRVAPPEIAHALKSASDIRRRAVVVRGNCGGSVRALLGGLPYTPPGIDGGSLKVCGGAVVAVVAVAAALCAARDSTGTSTQPQFR
ncbi:MAG: hypothetical protein FWD35_06705 [Oscillospiraceae bacterium]|nr:hypothetical protein [Oscillospiraceae bacterium]